MFFVIHVIQRIIRLHRKLTRNDNTVSLDVTEKNSLSKGVGTLTECIQAHFPADLLLQFVASFPM